MAKITNLKDKLCAAPWLDPWKNKDADGKVASEAGYVRMDHDGYRWWLTSWPVHKDLYGDLLGKESLVSEFDAVIEAFKRSFKDRPAMGKWCRENLTLLSGGDEFNAYYEGKYGFYWFRMIDRRGDYNLYLHCYAKEAI